MIANQRHRGAPNPVGMLLVAAAAFAATLESAEAVPRVFLSPATAAIDGGQTVEVEVFVEDVADLKLYEIVLEVAGGDSGSLDLVNVEIDEARGDFVFHGISPLVCLPDAENLRITCSPLTDDCVSVATPPAYLGTYTFTASFNAGGTFDIGIVAEPDTFLLDCSGTTITPLTLEGFTIDVTPVPVPTVSEWGFILMTLLVLVTGTIILTSRTALRVQLAPCPPSSQPLALSNCEKLGGWRAGPSAHCISRPRRSWP